MLKLRLKSLQYAFPYLAICIIFIIDQWNDFIGILRAYKDGRLIEWDNDAETCLLGTVICLIIVIVFLYLILSGTCQKAIYTYIQNSGAPELTREKVELFLAKATYIYNLQYDKNYICSRNCVFTVFLDTQSVIQATKKVRIHRYKILLPIFKSSSIIITSVDGKRHIIDFRREKHADDAIEILNCICPQLGSH